MTHTESQINLKHMVQIEPSRDDGKKEKEQITKYFNILKDCIGGTFLNSMQKNKYIPERDEK